MKTNVRNGLKGQTLYLLPEKGGVHIKLVHGSHLEVSRDSGEVLPAIPIKLISRVVCNPNTNWQGGALQACLQHGVSLAYLDAGGKTIGYSLPNRHQYHSAPNLLKIAQDDPTWPERYADWRLNNYLSAMARALLGCSQPITAASRRDPEQQLQKALFSKFDCDCLPWVNALSTLVEHEITAEIEQRYQSPLHLMTDRVPLVTDLNQILRFTVFTVVFYQHVLVNPCRISAEQWARHSFEKNYDKWRATISQLLFSFDQHLESEWP